MPRIPSGSEKQLLRLVEVKVQKLEAALSALSDETYLIGEALTVLNERNLYSGEALGQSLMWCAKTRELLFAAHSAIGKV